MSLILCNEENRIFVFLTGKDNNTSFLSSDVLIVNSQNLDTALIHAKSLKGNDILSLRMDVKESEFKKMLNFKLESKKESEEYPLTFQLLRCKNKFGDLKLSETIENLHKEKEKNAKS